MKKISVFFFLLFSPFVASALDYTLLEPIPGFLPTQASQSVEVYLVGLFRLTIAVAGLLAVIRITWCGFNLMMSVNPSAREEAKECIKLAIFGLLLALGSFLIINTIRVGTAGGVGIQNPFTLPSISSLVNGGGNTGGGGGATNPGAPVCTISSSNINLYEGQTTNISVSCTPVATSFSWSSSNGAPILLGTGGSVSFPTAGVYTYSVVGTNNAGTGQQSQLITIRVIARGTQSCSQDMPQAVTTPISCEQTNTTLNWSALGSGVRSAPVSLGSSQSLSVLFTTAGAGAYGSATTSAVTTQTTMVIDRVVDPLADPPVVVQETITVNLPANSNTVKYANISRASCDFRYENLDRSVCATYGTDIALNFQVGGGTLPQNSGAVPGCILEPNTAYVINIRNEDPTVPGLNTCSLAGTCEFNLTLKQSAGAQFTPEATAICAVPNIPQTPRPSLAITNLANNASVAPGSIPVSFTASDSSEITSLEFTVYNLDTGVMVDRQLGCTAGGLSALCTASTDYVTPPPPSMLSLSNSRTGTQIDTAFSCVAEETQYSCSASFQLANPGDAGAIRVYDSQSNQTIVPLVSCGQDSTSAIPACGSTVSSTASLTVGPGQGSYRIVANACGLGGCTTQSRTVIIESPCVRGQSGLTCFDLPNTILSSQELCAPQNGIASTISSSTAHAHHFRLALGESARLVVANRPMRACPAVVIRGFGSPVDRNDYVFTMAQVDLFTTPGGAFVTSYPPESIGQVTSNVDIQGGYRWRQVRFEDTNTSGWVYEHLLKRVEDEDARGPFITGNNWCNICGMASSSTLGTCDYVRNETLNVSIGRTPGDTSGMSQFLNDEAAVAGRCSNSLYGGTGRFDIVIKTSGNPGPNECVVSADQDYYVNVGTQIDQTNLNPRPYQEDYVVLYGRIPALGLPPAPMCSISVLPPPPPPPPVTPGPNPPPPINGLPIIPGASGFGITTPAGSGRNLSTPHSDIYRVTNLNDSGPGSLRACALASGPRTCIFEISGIINLSSQLEIRNPFITIAGQTAPSPGIMLTGNALTIQTSNVLVQHIRVRPGDAQPPLLYPLGDSRNLDYNNSDAVQVVGYPNPIQNVVVDHSSFGWSTDEMAQVWDNWNNVTFTNNIFANPLHDSFHNVVDTDESSGYFPHGYGPIAGGTNAGSVTFIGNLFANQEGRNPLAYSPESYIANNLIYNYNGGTAVNTHPGYPLPISSSVIGNVYIPGPNTGGMLPIIMEKTASSIIRVFLSDILHPSIGTDPWAGVRYISNNSGYLGTRPEFETVLQQLVLPGFTPTPSIGVESSVLSNAGARPLNRDSVDALVIQGVQNRTGSVINCVAADGSPRCSSNAGGWPSYPVNTRPIVLPVNPDADDNGDGYTNLENWLHSQAALVE